MNQGYDLFDEESLEQDQPRHVSSIIGGVETNPDDNCITSCVIEEIDTTNELGLTLHCHRLERINQYRMKCFQ